MLHHAAVAIFSAADRCRFMIAAIGFAVNLMLMKAWPGWAQACASVYCHLASSHGFDRCLGMTIRVSAVESITRGQRKPGCVYGMTRHGGHGHSHEDDSVAVQAALAHVIGDLATWHCQADETSALHCAALHGGTTSGSPVEFAKCAQVQSLGVCAAALCIWLEPFDIGSTSIPHGEAANALCLPLSSPASTQSGEQLDLCLLAAFNI